MDATPTADERPDLPGDLAMWVFVIGDLLIFSAYFIVYVVKRSWAPDEFMASQHHLNLGLGVLNTAILLISSWFIANAAVAARAGERDRAVRLTAWCAAAGVLFVAVKLVEWSAEIAGGHTFTSSEFFSFYWFFTGIHFLHVLLGLGILAVFTRLFRSGHAAGPRLVEMGATYWHMIDLLWVIILALLYMMR